MASFLAVIVSLVLATTVSSTRPRPPYQPAPYKPPPPPPVTTNRPYPYQPEPYKPPPPPPATTNRPYPYQPEPYKTPSGSPARSYPSQYNSPYQDGPYNGYQRDGYNQQPYEQPFVGKSPPRPEKDDNDDDETSVRDRLFAAIDSIQSQLNLASQSVANLNSQGSLQKKQITQLTILDLPRLEEKNIAQDKELAAHEKKLDIIEKLIDELEEIMNKLVALNAENAKEIKELEIALAKEEFIDSKQVRDIASLLSAAQSLESKLLIIGRNSFTLLNRDIHAVVGLLNAVSSLENSRICETGVTTLTKADKRSVILFNTDFHQLVPRVLHGIAGVRYKFEVEKQSYGSPYQPNYQQYSKPYDPRYSQYGSYPHRVREAGSVGDLVFVMVTTDGMIIEVTDQSFNNAEMESLDMVWMACSTGPGTELGY